MTEKRWKRTERAIAARLGGTRVPVSGRGRGDSPDIAHPSLSPEVKDRKSIPLWLSDAVSQAVMASAPEQLPIVVLHRARSPHDEDLVVMRLKDFGLWFDPRGDAA